MKRESPESLAAATSLLKKHEAFETDLAVHQDRIADVEKEGNKLVKEVRVVMLVVELRFSRNM